MIRTFVKGCVLAVLLFSLIGLLPLTQGFARQTPKKILILHSYHKATWTDSLLEGINSEIDHIPDLDPVIEYMDTKRINSEAYYRLLEQIYKMKYDKTHFDVILTTDDNAYRFALARQDWLFKNAPIVFCGVNRFDPKEIENKPLVTGVVEKGDFKDTLNFAAKVCKKAASVHVILDNTPTGKINKEAFLRALKSQLPGLSVDFLVDISLSDLAEKLKTLPSEDFAFFISFWEDGTGMAISPDNLSTAFYQSSVPIFGRSEWMINKGLTGGKCVSGFHQGQAAAQMARRILAGENVSDIPVNRHSPNRFMFDYTLLKRYHIDLSLIPSDSIIYNKPKPNFYQMHYLLIWSTATVVFILVTLVIALMLNMASRRKTEIALRESEEKYRRIFENSMVGFYQSTPAGRFVTANPAFAKMLGYKSPQDLIDSISDIATQFYVNAEDRIAYQNLIHQNGKVDGLEIRARRKDGSEIWVSITTRAYFNDKGRALFYEGAISNITDKKQAEKAVEETNEIKARFKKMESLGLLAGGVAHDLNNILSGIVGYPDLLLLELPKESPLRTSIEEIKESGEKATAVVQDLLTIARGVATTKEPLNLNHLVDEYLNSPEFHKLRQYNPKFEIKTNLAENLFNSYGSKIHIRKVIMNLISNAAEAIGINGRITISTENCYIDKPFHRYDYFKEGEYVLLSVADNGSGIKEEDRERIFEPFYTKKSMGRSGTGLGLAVVWNIVQDHMGFIDLISNSNNTAFSIYFPVTRQLMANKELHKPITSYQGHGEAVLVVDDIESQRELTYNMLKRLGYNAACVSSGEKAVEYVKQHDVDMVILDMIMDPGINGLETYQRLLQVKSKQKAIITSGFAQTDEVIKAQQLGAGRYIKKPFTLEGLGIAIKEELEN